MNKVILSTFAFCCLWSCKETEKSTFKHPKNQKNIVLIIADDLGYHDLGSYGNTYFETPHLDSLAQQGVQFTNMYSAGHVCSPTSASILTGQYPARVGVTNYILGKRTDKSSPVDPATYEDQLPKNTTTIAELLKDQGYATALMGKWHLGENTSFGVSDPKFHGFDTTLGFDYELLPVDETYKWFRINDGSEAYELPHLTNEITKNAVNYLDTIGTTPFFMTVAHYAVHIPLQGEHELIRKYEGKVNPRPGEYNATYGAMVESLDNSVGAILNALKANGLDNNTLVIFVSDNGGLALGEAGQQPTTNKPLRSGKGTMYEGGIKVPMIAYHPEYFESGKQDQRIVSTIDLFPTFLDFAGLTEEPADTDGVSFLTSQNDTKINGRPLFWHYPHFSNQGGRPKSTIRKGSYKLIQSLEDQSVELFDLSKDPYETNDISATNATVTSELLQELENWRNEVNANMPLKK